MEYGEYLAHYGVKGMKWGTRKARPPQQRGGGTSDEEDRILDRYEKMVSDYNQAKYLLNRYESKGQKEWADRAAKQVNKIKRTMDRFYRENIEGTSMVGEAAGRARNAVYKNADARKKAKDTADEVKEKARTHWFGPVDSTKGRSVRDKDDSTKGRAVRDKQRKRKNVVGKLADFVRGRTKK